MTLHDAIFTRKSTRVYEPDPIPDELFDAIWVFLRDLKPLDPFIPVGIDVLEKADMQGGLMGRAPNYIVFYSAESGNYLANAGFMMQQLCLFLSTLNLGCCWLGGARPKNKTKRGLVHVATLGFGKTDENPHYYPGDHKRRAAEEIADGWDSRIEAARLAPSARNGQPWYFACHDDGIDLFLKKNNPVVKAIFGKMNRIDMGIALCHLWLAGEQEGLPFSFSSDHSPAGKAPSGYSFFGQVSP